MVENQSVSRLFLGRPARKLILLLHSPAADHDSFFLLVETTRAVCWSNLVGCLGLLLGMQMWADSDRWLSERDCWSGRRSGSGNGRDFRSKHTAKRTGAAGFFLHLQQHHWNRQDCVRRQGTHHSAHHSIRKQFKVRNSFFSWTSEFCPRAPAARRTLFM